MRILLLLCIAISMQINAFAQDKMTFDDGYIGLAYVSKQSEPNLGLMGGGSRFFSKYNISVILDGSLDINAETQPVSGGSRYYWDTLSNGQRRCRDRQTGRFASSSNCESGTYDYNYSMRLSGLVNYHFDASENVDFILGAGYMITNYATPILSIGMRPNPGNPGVAGSIGFGKNYLYAGIIYIF